MKNKEFKEFIDQMKKVKENSTNIHAQHMSAVNNEEIKKVKTKKNQSNGK